MNLLFHTLLAAMSLVSATLCHNTCLREKDLDTAFTELNHFILKESSSGIIYHSKEPVHPAGSKCHPLSKLKDSHSFRYIRDLSNCPWNYHYSNVPSRFPRYILHATLKHCSGKPKNRNKCISFRGKKSKKIKFQKSGECRAISVKLNVFYRNETDTCFYPRQETVDLGFTCVIKQ